MSAKITSSIGKYGEDPIWDEYFMGIALLSAKRSKDGNRQVGACIVNDEPLVIGTGYNGMPLNCRDALIWGPEGDIPQETDKDKKHGYVCHAELNAIVNRNPKSVKDCTVYVTLFPCHECAKIIINSGIKRVIYASDEKAGKKSVRDSKSMLKANKVECIALDKKIDIGKVKNKIHFRDEDSSSDGPGAAQAEVQEKMPPISWDHYFMSLAVWSGQVRSEKDDLSNEGACIVNEDKRIVGLGYVQNIIAEKINKKTNCVMHAPVKAIVNQSPTSMKGCTLYTVRHPCNECAKVIVQSGITKVIHLNEVNERCQDEMFKKKFADKMKEKRRAADRMLAIAHIKPEPYDKQNNKMETLSLDFAPKRARTE